MKGWRSTVFYTVIGLLGVVTAIEAIDMKALLLPLVCHVPPDAQIVADECTGRIIKYVGMFMTGIATVGLWLRTITNTAIFKSLKND